MLSWTDKGKYRAALRMHNGYAMVEIRIDDGTGGETLVIVSNEGYITTQNHQKPIAANLRISNTGPITLSFKEHEAIRKVISEARSFLRDFKKRGRVSHINHNGKCYCGAKVDNKTRLVKVSATCKNCLNLAFKKGYPQ